MCVLIYLINVQEQLYIGHTTNFKKRKADHRCNTYNENSPKYNFRIYQAIRENHGEFGMIQLYKIPEEQISNTLKIEQSYIDFHNAELNSMRAYQSREDRLAYLRDYGHQYSKQNKALIKSKRHKVVICECGASININNIAKHRKTANHKSILNICT